MFMNLNNKNLDKNLDLSHLPKSFFKQDTVEVAKRLIGKILKHGKTYGIITEVEAYKGPEEGDEASHAFKRTKRSELMYNSYGKFYVYFVYGNYFCVNITTEKNKPGAVLIRALKPLTGISIMKKRRGTSNEENLTKGPGKLCQALNITKDLNGTDINDKAEILKGINITPNEIKSSSRIGIKKATHLKWRFFV